jgi:DNA-binding transcriptional LysR family regulator
MGFARGELPQTHWVSGKKRIVLDGVFFSNSNELLCRLATRAQGIALVPEAAAAAYVERGELVVLPAAVVQVEGRIALVYPERDLIPSQVRAFIDWMTPRLPALFPHVPAPTHGRAARRSDRRA